MAVRGPTGVGAHVGQLEEPYGPGTCVSTPADRRRAVRPKLTASSCPAVYPGSHDYACAHAQPSLVGRLTAADLPREHACAHGRRLGGRSVSPSREWLGRPARRSDTTHAVTGRAGHDEDLQRDQADRSHDPGELPGRCAAVGRCRPDPGRRAVLRRRPARADRRARAGARTQAEPAGRDAAARRRAGAPALHPLRAEPRRRAHAAGLPAGVHGDRRGAAPDDPVQGEGGEGAGRR